MMCSRCTWAPNIANFGLVAGLEQRGCEIVIPTQGMPIGRQLQFYASPERDMSDREADVGRLYEILAAVEVRCGGKRELSHCNGHMGWPSRGALTSSLRRAICVRGREGPRVVRVGTHALRPSSSSLWGRLSQHRGSVGGSLPGGGNHRGSIFRLHVGTALLSSGDWPESIRSSWGVGGSASAETRTSEYPLERAVSDRIGAMPFLWVAVDDEPGASNSDRGVIERGAIALLSNVTPPATDPPSPGWLWHAVWPAMRFVGLAFGT